MAKRYGKSRRRTTRTEDELKSWKLQGDPARTNPFHKWIEDEFNAELVEMLRVFEHQASQCAEKYVSAADGTNLGLTNEDILMSAVEFAIKQKIGGLAMSRESAIARLQPLIFMLCEGMPPADAPDHGGSDGAAVELVAETEKPAQS